MGKSAWFNSMHRSEASKFAVGLYVVQIVTCGCNALCSTSCFSELLHLTSVSSRFLFLLTDVP